MRLGALQARRTQAAPGLLPCIKTFPAGYRIIESGFISRWRWSCMNGNEEPIRPEDVPAEDIIAQRQGNGYILKGVGGQIGEITYRLVDVDTWILDHTYVDPQYRGGNLAKQLLNLVVDDAREKGRKIIPACAYALAQFKRNPEYADVWEKTEKEANYSDHS
ncbi:GNAT family N-acetyltransferase [Paenibacillus sacheonensis]